MRSDHLSFIEAGLPAARCREYGVYPHSVREDAFMADLGDRDVLVAKAGLGFQGDAFSVGGCDWVLAELSHENAGILRSRFPFTAPVSVLKHPRTLGLGDRLGLAAPGHLQALKSYDALPILAQQSVRELTLTGRSFPEVLDCASWAVFREGYTGGFGADGDHLKTFEEVQHAIDCGYTMITLDCSEHIRNDIGSMTAEEVARAYRPDRAREERYLGKCFTVEDCSISFPEEDFRRMCLIYNDAIDFAARVYERFFRGREELDFEVSIDETATTTAPAQHFYVASELLARGVKPATVAPRFCGEFQKGIDYIGDPEQFEAELRQHAAIARHFGYKISVHSGSDKFSVFPRVGRQCRGVFHVKTAGTSWLEAMAVIARQEPALYREIHRFALEEAFAEATKYYHVTTDLNNIPPLAELADDALPALFSNNDARQLIHITYGGILQARNADGSFRFRDRLYRAWRSGAAAYAQALEGHIGKHLSLLYRDIPGTEGEV